MSYFRTNNVRAVVGASTGSLTNAWGILPVSGAVGTLYLQPAGGVLYTTASLTSMSIAHIQSGQPFPCYPTRVEVTTGTVYLLA